jgi:CubicO group peptidase (beta-lactamase class C family)
MTAEEVERLVGERLDEFYRRRIAKLQGLQLTATLKRKNPYLFRATGMQNAQDIVESLLLAYMSSSDETFFGNSFFEPLVRGVAAGEASPSPGVDVAVVGERTYMAIAVKSGPSDFNAQSRHRQGDEFRALRSRLQKIQKQFDPLVGYCYGRKRQRSNTAAEFRELAGQQFWTELTGDGDFYLKIIRAMKDRPALHRQAFQQAWSAACNRFVREFTTDFCLESGEIDWDKLTQFNSGNG